MNNTNTKLKPLTHKKSLNNQPLNQPAIDPKQTTKKVVTGGTIEKKKVAETPLDSNMNYPKVKYTRSSNRPKTTVQLYDCDDFQMPKLQEDAYFESQLQKNIKVQNNPQKTQKVVPKNQVVLPKLENDSTLKQMKDLEKQMDLEMSRMLDKEMQEDI